MHASMCVRRYVCMCIMYAGVYVCIYVCIYGCMYICMHVWMRACMYTCMCVVLCVCVSVYMHACMHACMHLLLLLFAFQDIRWLETQPMVAVILPGRGARTHHVSSGACQLDSGYRSIMWAWLLEGAPEMAATEAPLWVQQDCVMLSCPSVGSCSFCSFSATWSLRSLGQRICFWSLGARVLRVHI